MCEHWPIDRVNLRKQALSRSFELWREHLAGLPDCNFTVTEKPLTATFTHPGLNFNSFDRSHNIGILSLMDLVVDIRAFATKRTHDKESLMFNLNQFFEDCLTFVLSTEFSMSRTMYDKSVPKWPLKAKMYLGYIGNSTLALPVELFAPGVSEPIMRQCNQIATVDMVSRRSKPLPEKFRDILKDQCAMSEGFRVHTFKRPENTFMYKRKVMWLDTDINEHTNYASYVMYALDGLHAAIKQEKQRANTSNASDMNSCGIESVMTSTDSMQNNTASATDAKRECAGSPLKGICEEIIQEGLKNLKVCYVNECEDGDVLDIHVWQEEGEGLIVRCSVEKESKLICQMILEYFSPLSKL